MLHLLAWLFFAWQEYFGAIRKEQKGSILSSSKVTTRASEPEVVEESAIHASQVQDVSKSYTFSMGDNKDMYLDTKGVPIQNIKENPWHGTPPSYDSLFSPKGSKYSSNGCLDRSIEQLVEAASWHAVNDEPEKAQFYMTHRGPKSKRDTVQEDDILPMRKDLAESSFSDDVFMPNVSSEVTQRRGRFPEAKATSGTAESNFTTSVSNRDNSRGFEGTERTTLIAVRSSMDTHAFKSVSVNVTDYVSPGPSFKIDDDDLANDSGCLSDLSQTPKHFKSSLHKTLHSPFGSQENIAMVSYQLEVDNTGHRRLDSWDSLRVDQHSVPTKLSISSPKLEVEGDVKMKVTVRPKSTDLSSYESSPIQVSVGPNRRNMIEIDRPAFVVMETKATDQLQDKELEKRNSAYFDYGFAIESEENLVMATTAEQTFAPSSLAERSPLGSGKTLSDSVSPIRSKEKNVSRVKQAQERFERGVNADDGNAPLSPTVKLQRKLSFDSDSQGKSESFTDEPDKGLQVGSPPAANFQDFEEIMRKRRRKVDVMDKAGNVFAAFGNREAKVTAAAPTKARQRWQKIRFVVFSGQYKKMK